jgi:thioredoxin 1
MGPIVTRLASDFEGRALVGRVDTPTQQALVRAWSVTATPTYIFFKGGREVSRQRGTTSYEDLAGKLQALLAAP